MNREYSGRSSIYTGRPMTPWLDMPAMLINNADILHFFCSLPPSPFVLIYTIIFLLNELSERNDGIDTFSITEFLTCWAINAIDCLVKGQANLYDDFFPVVPPTPAWRTHCILFITPQRFSFSLSAKYSCLVLLLFAFYLHICFGKVRSE